MGKIQVFDPAMCCNTGVCGPEVDPLLVTFAADLEWLVAQGAQVERINLAQQPQLFAQHDAIRNLLEARGDTALPAIVVGGEIKLCGQYPSREQLAQWADVPLGLRATTDTTDAKSSAACCVPASGKGTAVSSKCC